MKKIYLIVLFAIVCGSAISQPIMTAANFNIVAGDSFLIHMFTPTSINPGGPGGGQFWDFSSTVGTSSDVMHIVTVGSTPQGTQFPTAHLAAEFQGDYEYLLTNPSTLERDGFWISNSWTNNYTDNQILMSYPLTTGQSFTDNLNSNFYNGNQWYRSGSTTVTADGYGMLAMPWGFVSNVLRLHITENYSDIGSAGNNTTSLDRYAWVVPGTHHWLYEISEKNYNGTITRSGQYLDASSIPTGVENIELSGIGLTTYPNPCTDYVNISFVLPAPVETEYVISNQLGQEVYRNLVANKSAGPAGARIDVSGWNEGVYFISIRAGKDSVSRKFIVRR